MFDLHFLLFNLSLTYRLSVAPAWGPLVQTCSSAGSVALKKDFYSEDDFQNGAMLPIQLASVHRLRSPASKVTCPLSKELARKSWFFLLKRFFRTWRVHQQISENSSNIINFSDFALLTSGLKVTCFQSVPGDCDLKISIS